MDHELAVLLAAALGKGGLAVEENPKGTNMIYFAVPAAKTDALCHRCAQRGVLISAAAPGRIRLVTHCDISKEGAEEAGQILLEEARAL